MDVIITEWALQSYLDHVARKVFTRDEYKKVIRPDAERLKSFPSDQKFKDSNFWGPATDRANKPIPEGYKMKWHNIGSGKVQLRLAVAISLGKAFLCQAYVKDSPSKDKREAAKLKTHINHIYAGRYQIRGQL